MQHNLLSVEELWCGRVGGHVGGSCASTEDTEKSLQKATKYAIILVSTEGLVILKY